MKDPASATLAVSVDNFRRRARELHKPRVEFLSEPLQQSRQPPGVLQRHRRKYPPPDPTRTSAPLIGITIAHPGFSRPSNTAIPHHVDWRVYLRHRDLEQIIGAKLAGLAAFRLRRSGWAWTPFLGSVPIVLFSFGGGVLADRMSRQLILVGSQVVQLTCAFRWLPSSRRRGARGAAPAV